MKHLLSKKTLLVASTALITFAAAFKVNHQIWSNVLLILSWEFRHIISLQSQFFHTPSHN